MRKGLLLFFLALLYIAATAQNTSNCDVITLKDGKLIYCKIIQVKGGTIDYAECNGQSGIVQHVKSDSASMINHADGSFEMLHKGHEGATNSSSGQGAYTIVYVNGGVSLPRGIYNQKSAGFSYNYFVTGFGYVENGVGYAGSGPEMNAGITSFLNDKGNFGFSVLLGYTENSFDFPSYFNDFSKIITQPNESISLNGYDPSDYKNYRVMAGPAFALHIGKLNLDINALLGIYFCSYSGANYTYTLQYNGSSYSQAITSTNVANEYTKGVVDLMIGGRYPIYNKLSLQVSGSFVYANKLSGTSFSIIFLPNQYYLGDGAVSFISLTGGLVYELGK